MPSLLNENDLKKINFFSTLLFNDLVNIETNVLNLLSDFFGFNTCSYICSDIFADFLKNSRKCSPICNNISDGYVNDCIPKSIVSIEEIISPGEFENHYYNEFLASQNLRYEIDINISNNNDGNHYTISIFKDENEGPFTDKERLILNYIYHVINANFSRFLFMTTQTENDAFLQSTLDNLPFGLAIYNESFELIKYNSQAGSYFCQITDSSNTQTAHIKFTDLIFPTGQLPNLSDTSSTSKEFENHSVTIAPSVSFVNQSKILKCYYVYIRENEIKVCPDEKVDLMMLNKIDLISKYGLTVREIDIVQLFYSGKSNKEISEILFISINTLKSHLSNIYRKLEVSNKLEAILLLSN